MRTEVKILQHNRLDANSFVSEKLWKRTKICTNIFEEWNKNFRDARKLETGEFSTH